MDIEPIVFTKQDWRLLSNLESRQYSELKGITDEMSKSITRALMDSAAAGLGANKTAHAIQEAAGMAYRRAETIARTETIRAAAQAAQSKYEELGVKEYEFLAASDARVCGECAQYNHKIYPIDDTEHLPPIHPNCRCAIAPVIGNRRTEIQKTEQREREAERQQREKEDEERKRKEEEERKRIEKEIEEKKKEEEKKKIEEFREALNQSRTYFANRLKNEKTIDTIINAESHDDLFKGMKARYNPDFTTEKGADIIKRNCVIVSIENNIMFEAVKESVIKADAVFKDIPLLSKYYNAISLIDNTNSHYETAFATSNGNRIRFGRYFRNEYGLKNLLTDTKRDFESHWHPSDKLESHYIHELGHCAEYLYGAVVSDGKITKQQWNDHIYATKIMKKAITNLERRMRNDPKFEPILDEETHKKYWKQISRYAYKKGDAEAISEAFADYYCNGDKAKEISKEIVKVIMEAVN